MQDKNNFPDITNQLLYCARTSAPMFAMDKLLSFWVSHYQDRSKQLHVPASAGCCWLFRLGLAKCMYPVFAGRTQPYEVERVDRCQAFAPCVGHVTLCNLRSPGKAAALTALHVGVLCRGSNVAVLWVVSPGDLQSNSTRMKPTGQSMCSKPQLM